MKYNTMNTRYYVLGLVAVALGVSLISCGSPNAKGDEAIPEVSIPVRVEELELSDFNITYNSIGSVTSEHMVNLLFEASGKVEEIYIEVGEKVSSGQALAKIKSNVYETAFAQAKAMYEKAQSDLESSEKLYSSNVISSDQLKMASLGVDNTRAGFTQAKNMLDNTILRAPFDGHIVTRNLNVGDLTSPAAGMQPPFVLADMEQLKVVIPVPEARVGMIQIGQQTELEFKSFPDRKFNGEVRRIGMAPKDLSNNYDVEIFIDDTDRILKLGLVADVHIVLDAYSMATTVPMRLIQDDGVGTYVYQAAEGRARRVPVKVIALNGTDALIESELMGGDTLIVRGHKDVRNGSLLDIVELTGA